jgi:NAD(P)-dependent dehydrogenase (short-subunit alcohol dehydrogenase family)
VRSGGDAIVNNASIAGVVGFPEMSPSVANKHGALGLTRTAALEYSQQGVRVNAICPGVIDTSMIERSSEASGTVDQAIAATPIGRLGEPEEIGDVAVWLCSADASFVTGEPMVVDGGYVGQ